MQELFRRKYLISFFYLIVCIVGYSAWKNIPIENAPELNLPSLTVNYNWGSTVPEVVEKEITRKVESTANRLRDVTEINSVTQEGRSSVTIKFLKHAPVEFRALELREYLYTLEESLPVSVSPATISRNVPQELEDQQTFMTFTLSGEMESRELLEYSRQSIKPKLLGIEGLARVELLGVQDPALILEFDRTEIEKYNLSANEIGFQIRDKLRWRSSGYIESANGRLTLMVPPEFENSTDISNMQISIPGSAKLLSLSNVAKVTVTDFPAKSIKRINGSPALTIELVKEGGADAMGLAREVLNRIDGITESLPTGMALRLQFDSTERLREQFDELAEQAVFSAILVFMVVLIFIRKVRAPFVIIGSVLFSILMSLTILYLFDYTLNVITLAGITIALGMLIDNAVVVFEQVNPGLPQTRAKRIEHIRQELPKSVIPVLGSTFTTVGIFIPLLFALDELRIFLMPLAIALTVTLISSVLISFSWIPYSLIWLTPNVGKKKYEQKKKLRSKVQYYILRCLILRNRLRWVFILTLIGLIGLPLFLIEDPDWEETDWPEFTKVYFDNRDEIDPWIGGLTFRFAKDTFFGSPWRGRSQEYISVYIRSPQGTPLSEIDKIVSNYETLAKPYEHSFDYYEARMSEYFGASIRFVIKPEYLLDVAPYYFFGEAMYLAARTGNVATSVSGFGDGISTGFGGTSSSHTIRLNGYSYDELLDLAKEIQRRLEKNRRVREVDINSSSLFRRNDFYQYELDLDDEKLMALGLNKSSVLNALAMDINPVNTLGKVEFEGRQMYLIGRTEADRFYEDDLMDGIRVTNASSFDLTSVGEINKKRALTEIRRTNQSYERKVTLQFLGNFRMGREYVQSVLDKIPVPVGAKIDFGNSFFFNLDNSEEKSNLWFVAILSIISVWMIVSALLESWTGPLFILLAIPFSAIGIMLGTLVNDLAFDRGAIAGALLCVGVVVNNAILLIHQKAIEHKRGVYGLRCWYRVFRKKIRPILITTTTTVVGLFPMIFYGSNEFWQGLAVIVCWGLLFSTSLLVLLAGVNGRSLLTFKKMA